MSIAIDGTAHVGASNAATATLTINLTTTNATDVVCIAITINGVTVTGVTDNSGHTGNSGTWSNTVNGIAAHANSGSNSIYYFWNTTTAALSSATITVTFGNTGWNFCTLDAWGVSGANTSNPFDGNGVIPVLVTTTDAVISTSNANDMIIAMYGTGVDPCTVGSGFTAIAGGTTTHDFQMVEYQVVSATQASLTCGGNAANSGNRGIAIAIQASAAVAPPIFGCQLM